MDNLRDRKILAIKTVRQLTGAGLKEAKRLVDTIVVEMDRLEDQGDSKAASYLESTFSRLIGGVVVDEGAEELENVYRLLEDVKGGLARSEQHNTQLRNDMEAADDARNQMYSELTKAEDQRDSALETIVMLAKRVYQ